MAKAISTQFESLFNEDQSKLSKGAYTVDAKAQIRAVKSEDEIASNETVFKIGHNGGLHHPEDDYGFAGWLFNKPGYGIDRSSNNFMFAGGTYGKYADPLNKTPTGPTRNQINHIYNLYQSGKLNRKDVEPRDQ